jgi:hypothetical protein
VSALNNRLQQLEKIVLLQNDRITSLEKSNKDLERIILEKSERVNYLENAAKKTMPLGSYENGNIIEEESNVSGSSVENTSDSAIRDSVENIEKRQHINRQGMKIGKFKCYTIIKSRCSLYDSRHNIKIRLVVHKW